MCSNHKVLYVSDLDGTLLNNDSRVSPFTAQALNDLIARGMLFSIATARTPATVVSLMHEIDLQLPVILMTGAVAYDINNKEYLTANFFEQGVAAQLVHAICNTGIYPMVYYLHRSLLHVAYHTPLTAGQQRFMHERCNSPYKRFVPVNDFSTVPDGSILVFCMDNYERLSLAHDAVAAIPGHKSYLYRDSLQPGTGYLEIYPQATTKAAAITQLAHRVEAHEIVVFGDNCNDIPMFDIASRSYAVANAVDDVKARATGIIGANSDNGVAHFLLHEWGATGINSARR